MRAPDAGDDWIALTAEALDLAEAQRWATVPSCGAVVGFAGTVRDHTEGRSGVTSLTYEAYESRVEPAMARLAASCRSRWPATGRVALWHRTGTLGLGEVAVVVVVSSPHRGPAFDAARWLIDTVKEVLPIWKHETWAGGAAWGTCARDIAVMEPS